MLQLVFLLIWLLVLSCLWFYTSLMVILILISGRPQSSQPPASKGAYSQVGYSYKGDGNEQSEDLNSDDEEEEEEEEDEEDDKDFSSDDSSDERMEIIAKDFGVKRYNWLIYMDKKAKEEEKRQKEIIKGDPSIVSTLIA
jgi:splicing factor, arginine/serine-rich 16